MPPKFRSLKKETSVTSNPPSHPHEQSSEHRAFLKRSLDRSDKELAALQTLHRTLRKLKSIIVKKFGESRLLDIGEGLVFLSKETRELVIPPEYDTDNVLNPDVREEFATLAKDFLLRLELRKKLMNRLARRMLRLSHAMDGRIAKVNPPPVPKYGEIRLLSNTKLYEEKLKKFENDLKEKETVQNRIRERIENCAKEEGNLASTGEEEVKDSSNTDELEVDPLLFNKEHQEDLQKLIEYDQEYDKIQTINLSKNVTKITPALSEADIRALDKQPEDFDLNKEEYKDDIGATIRMNHSEKAMEWKRWKTEFLSRIPDQPTLKDLGMSNLVYNLEERRKRLKTCDSDQEAFVPSDDVKVEVADEQEGAQDVDMVSSIKSNDEVALEQAPDAVPSTTNDKQKEEKDDTEVDHDKDKSSKEYYRKKLFSLDPIPSFYEQDYSRALVIHADIASSSLKESSRKIMADATAEYNEAFRMSTEWQNKKFSLENERKKLHMDFQAKAQMFERSRMAAYQDWQNKKKQFESQQLARKQMEFESRGRLLPREYARAIRMEDKHLVKRALSSVVDRVVIRNAPMEHACGTRYTSLQVNSPNILVSQVATALAHCVDVVVNRIEGGWISTSVIDEMKRDEYPPFRYLDPAKTMSMNEKGETFQELNARITSQLAKVSKQLASCEQVRAQKWSKLVQAKHGGQMKGQMKTPTQPSKNKPTKHTSKNTPTHHQQQSPPQQPQTQRQQKQQTSQPVSAKSHVPSAPAVAPVEIPAKVKHTPVATTPSTSSSTTNKYSIEAVRARISADGCVRPISTPKMTKDGLYMRPAGRQRKGMDWDAVNGIWVPQRSNWNHN